MEDYRKQDLTGELRAMAEKAAKENEKSREGLAESLARYKSMTDEELEADIVRKMTAATHQRAEREGGGVTQIDASFPSNDPALIAAMCKGKGCRND